MADWYDHYAPEMSISDSFRQTAKSIAEGTEKQQKRDLKYVISDFGEMFSESGEDLPEYDDFFTSRGAISVSELVMLYRGGMKKILKRGKIRNEDEAITVNGLISQMDTDLSEEDRNELTRLLVDYESKIA